MRALIARSLFAKILLWFLVATVTASVAAVVVNQLSGHPTLLDAVVGRLLRAHADQALAELDGGGREALAAYRRRIEAALGGRVYLTDPAGADLVDGTDRGVLARTAGRWGTTTVFRWRQPVLTSLSSDGRARIFLPVSRGVIANSFSRPAMALVLLASVGLCWALARHVTKPLRQLQAAVERFGQGETEARIGSDRSDELGQLARSFDQMADRTNELVAGQRRLLLDISHELRSPLARLTIAADLLRDDPGDAETLAQIEREAERLNELVGEILSAHRPAEPGARRAFAPVRLDEVASEVVSTCRLEAEARGRRIEWRAGEAVTLRGDREALRRAIENVIRNAVRFAPEGTAVDVALVRDAVEAIVRVRDRGPGAPESALPHLFNPFYRAETDRSRETGGVGLGLTIARRAVESHGGRITARNAAPGLEVEIALPLEGSPPAAPAGGSRGQAPPPAMV
ncbi:MAG: HAMP domain-containing protein [Acidobacteria bacterium]|nr:HAMP domain-containing protein [Acidobacteriota bacterium]